jgi:hypothetical protein
VYWVFSNTLTLYLLLRWEGSLSRFASFSIWEYSFSMPAKWPSPNEAPVTGLQEILNLIIEGAVEAAASLPTGFTPWSSSHTVASRPTPG